MGFVWSVGSTLLLLCGGTVLSVSTNKTLLV